MATPLPPLHFYINPPFSVLKALSSKIFGNPQVTQFLEGPNLLRGGGGEGGSNYENNTGNQKKGYISLDEQQSYYLQVC